MQYFWFHPKKAKAPARDGSVYRAKRTVGVGRGEYEIGIELLIGGMLTVVIFTMWTMRQRLRSTAPRASGERANGVCEGEPPFLWFEAASRFRLPLSNVWRKGHSPAVSAERLRRQPRVQRRPGSSRHYEHSPYRKAALRSSLEPADLLRSPQAPALPLFRKTDTASHTAACRAGLSPRKKECQRERSGNGPTVGPLSESRPGRDARIGRMAAMRRLVITDPAEIRQLMADHGRARPRRFNGLSTAIT